MGQAGRSRLDRRRGWLAIWAASAAIVAFMVYLPAARNGFTNWDDTAYIHNNPHMTAPDGLTRIWLTGESPQYYPLTFTTFWAEYHFFGTQPFGYHLVNIAVHSANAALVVVLMILLGLPAPAAWAVAMLFALSPIQVMSVAWVAERKNVLSTFFGLLSLICVCRWFRGGGKSNYALALLAFVMALLSKTAWLMLPVVAGTAGRLFFKRRSGWLAGSMAPFVVVAILASSVTWLMERQFTEGEFPMLAERLLIAPRALAYYLYKSLLPFSLYPFYPRWDVAIARPASWLPALAVVIGIALLIRVRTRLHPLVVWGLVTFAAFLLPVLGIIPFGNMDLTWVSDHFVYYAVIGLYAAVVVIARGAIHRVTLRHRLRLAVPAAVTVLAVAAVMTLRQIPVWNDARSMWRRAAERNPDSHVPHAGLALAHVGRQEYDQAIDEYRAALHLKPDDAYLRGQLAWVYLNLGRRDQAEVELQRALTDNPRSLSAHLGLGRLEVLRGNDDQAAGHYQRALELAPGNADAASCLADTLLRRHQPTRAEAVLVATVRENPRSVPLLRRLAMVYDQLDRPAEARRLGVRVLELEPDDAETHFLLGVIEAREGRLEAALTHYRRAAEIEPGSARHWNNWGSVLLETGHPKEAAVRIREALAVDPGDHRAWNNLGSAMHQLGDRDQAIQCLRRALEIEPNYVNAHHRMGKIMAEDGRYAEAAEYLNEAIAKVGPSAGIGMVDTLARILAACPDQSVRDPPAAVVLAENVCKAMNYGSHEALDTLGIAYAAQGRFDEAVEAATEALRLARDGTTGADIAALERRLEQFRRRDVYIGP